MIIRSGFASHKSGNSVLVLIRLGSGFACHAHLISGFSGTRLKDVVVLVTTNVILVQFSLSADGKDACRERSVFLALHSWG